MNWLKTLVTSLMHVINKKADKSEIEQLKKNKADKIDIAQSDWAINDPNDPRYIQNRTHSVIPAVYGALLNEIIVDIPNPNQFVDVNIPASPSGGFYLNYGDKYTVIWDGVTYADVEVVNHGGSGYEPGLGNYGGIFSITESESQNGSFYITSSIPGTHTFSVIGLISPAKYTRIPSEFLNTDDIDSKIATLRKDADVAKNAILYTKQSLTSSQKLQVQNNINAMPGHVFGGNPYFYLSLFGMQATGNHAFAGGDGDTIASGIESFAFGHSVQAQEQFTVAFGRETIAAGLGQFVTGKHNIVDTDDKYAHIVGNGRLDTARSNAHTIDWNGLGWFAGGLKVGGTGQDDTNAKAVATEEYVNSPKSQLILTDQETGENYILCIKNGNLVTYKAE